MVLKQANGVRRSSWIRLRIAIALLAVVLGVGVSYQAQAQVGPTATRNASLDLTGVKVSDLVRVYLERLDSRPYVLCPEVVSDYRVISIRTGQLRSWTVLVAALEAVGYDVKVRRGIVKVCAAEEPEEKTVIAAKKDDSVQEQVEETQAPVSKNVSVQKQAVRERVMGTAEIWLTDERPPTQLELFRKRFKR